MAYVEKHYPNLTWTQFAVCNDDATGAFEDMARRLFSLEFLGELSQEKLASRQSILKEK